MSVVDSPKVASSEADRTTLHKVWKAILAGVALLGATACYFAPVLLAVFGVLVLLLLCARLAYRDRDRYIPCLYARDTKLYDDAYRAFIAGTLGDIRGCKIAGHPLLWEASRLARAGRGDSDGLLL